MTVDGEVGVAYDCGAYFVVGSVAHSPEELNDILGTSDHASAAGYQPLAAPPEAVWRLRSDLPGTGEVDKHLDRLFKPLSTRRAAIRSLADHGCYTKLVIVQYLDPAASEGFGIFLNMEWVSLLADLSASVDIDQYAWD